MALACLAGLNKAVSPLITCLSAVARSVALKFATAARAGRPRDQRYSAAVYTFRKLSLKKDSKVYCVPIAHHR